MEGEHGQGLRAHHQEGQHHPAHGRPRAWTPADRAEQEGLLGDLQVHEEGPVGLPREGRRVRQGPDDLRLPGGGPRRVQGRRRHRPVPRRGEGGSRHRQGADGRHPHRRGHLAVGDPDGQPRRICRRDKGECPRRRPQPQLGIQVGQDGQGALLLRVQGVLGARVEGAQGVPRRRRPPLRRRHPPAALRRGQRRSEEQGPAEEADQVPVAALERVHLPNRVPRHHDPVGSTTRWTGPRSRSSTAPHRRRST